MKNLGKTTYILGIRIYRDRSKRLLALSQNAYIDKMLKRFSMEDSRRRNFSMSHGIHLSKAMGQKTQDKRDKMSQAPFASTIGSIMYVMLCMRLDVAYALSICGRYQADPGEKHWIAVKNILKYLRRTKEMFVVYGGEEHTVKGFTDASFQTDHDFKIIVKIHILPK